MRVKAEVVVQDYTEDLYLLFRLDFLVIYVQALF